MAVLKMQKISIYALKSDRKPILELLQRRGVVEITDLDPGKGVFTHTDTQQAQSNFEKSVQTAEQALSILGSYSGEKKSLLASLAGRTPISLEQYEEGVKEIPRTLKAAENILSLGKNISDNKAEILRLEAQGEALKPWMELDVPMRFRGTKSTTALIGSLPSLWSREDLLAALAKAVPEASDLELEIISASNDQTCLFVLCGKLHAGMVEESLRALGFSYPAAPPAVPPREQSALLAEKEKELRQENEKAEQKIAACSDQRDQLRFAADYFSMRAEKYGVISRLAQSRHAFIVTGYIPQKNTAVLQKELTDRFSAAVEFEEPGEQEDVPVALQNIGYAEPMEPVLESYSMPGKGEVDPCFVMSLFYYVLFGMMLSDAAYGFILAAACGIILLKFKNMESGMKKAIKMFFFCGLSTIFWGIMFGGYFGDAIDVISQTFFGVHLTIPAVWFVPTNEPMRFLVFAFLVGIIHLFTGLGVQFYQLTRGKKYKDALYDVVFWYMLVGGGILYILTIPMVTQMLSVSFTLPPIVGTVSAICAGIAAVGIVATAGRESKNPFKRLLKGLYGLYNVSGYLSDILSYSRLLALGLATGVIANVFNKMGSMVGGGVIGAIVFLVVFVLGHTMNIGINVLGAYVHTNRLQYVEFFGKFYQGGGRKFSPFAVHTKYYKIKEEN